MLFKLFCTHIFSLVALYSATIAHFPGKSRKIRTDNSVRPDCIFYSITAILIILLPLFPA